MDLRYLEDIEVGALFDLGAYEMRREEIEAFKERWDPGNTHAADGTTGDLGMPGQPIASGIHSIAVQQRLASSAVLGNWAVVAGRRLRDVSFDAPVRAGMTLSGELIIDEVVVRSPRTGLVVFTVRLRHGGQVVLRVAHEAIVLRRRGPTMERIAPKG